MRADEEHKAKEREQQKEKKEKKRKEEEYKAPTLAQYWQRCCRDLAASAAPLPK